MQVSNMLTEPSRGISLKRLLTTSHPSICYSPDSKKTTYRKSRYFVFPMYCSRENVLELGEHRLLVQQQYVWIEGWYRSRALCRMASLPWCLQGIMRKAASFDHRWHQEQVHSGHNLRFVLQSYMNWTSIFVLRNLRIILTSGWA